MSQKSSAHACALQKDFSQITLKVLIYQQYCKFSTLKIIFYFFVKSTRIFITFVQKFSSLSLYESHHHYVPKLTLKIQISLSIFFSDEKIKRLNSECQFERNFHWKYLIIFPHVRSRPLYLIFLSLWFFYCQWFFGCAQVEFSVV